MTDIKDTQKWLKRLNLNYTICEYNNIKELPVFPKLTNFSCDKLIVLENDIDKIKYYKKIGISFKIIPANKLSRKLYC